MGTKSHTNVIELNGNVYDARTGTLITNRGSAKPAKPAAPITSHSASNVPVMDGFVRRKQARPVQPSATSHKSHAVQKSKTLMRSAVKKPLDAKILSKSTAHSERILNSHQEEPRLFSSKKDQERAARAQATNKSKIIKRFHFSDMKLVSKLAQLPVKQAPKKREPEASHTAAPLRPPSDSSRTTRHHDLKKEIIANGLQNAQSHTKATLHKPTLRHRAASKLHVSNRAVNVGMGLFIALGIGGVIVYKNIPTITMRIASARSGVHSQLPAYTPAGFDVVGPIQYSPGEVQVEYKAVADERNFSIVQKNSEWNTETLQKNFVNKERRMVQTFQDKGRTIFLYDGSNATWVDGGVWYKVEGEASLTSDQLRRIAESL